MSIKKFSIGAAQVASFKEQLTKAKQGGGGGNPNFLKLEGPNPQAKKEGPANVYKVRLIPAPAWKDKEITSEEEAIEFLRETLFNYKSHGWNSNKTGQWVTDVICPTTFGEGMDSNPIILYAVQQYKKLKEQGITDKEHPARLALRKLATKESWIVNVLVVDDPVNPENNGTVKLVKLGKNLYDMIIDAFTNDLFGPRIFSLNDDGCTFRISVGWNASNQKAFQTYKGSIFEQVGSALPKGKKVDEIYASYIDAASQFKQKTREELKALVVDHYIAKPEVASGDVDAEEFPEEVVEEAPKVAPKAATKTATKTATKAAKKTVVATVEGPSDDELQDLLDELPE